MYLGGALGPGPPGSPKGRKNLQEKRKGKERERGEKRKKGKEGIREKKRKEEGARKKKKRKLYQYDEGGAMQFQVQAGAPGKKTSGAPR